MPVQCGWFRPYSSDFLCILTAMPTGLRVGPYRFFFYSADREEPPHVHVDRETKRAKFWLNPVRLHESRGFNRAEINRMKELVGDEFFGE